MSFEQLLGDLEKLQTLQKSQTADGNADDQNIADAAADASGDGVAGGGDANPGGDGNATPAAANGEADPKPDDTDTVRAKAGDVEPIAKSFRILMEDGSEAEAIDGTELVKSLQDRVVVAETALATNAEQMLKALNATTELIKSQGEAIAALRGEIARLGNEGRGRKAIVTLADKPALADMNKSDKPGLPAAEFMSKALAAQAAGRITGLEVSIAEGSLNKGTAVPAHIVNKVLA